MPNHEPVAPDAPVYTETTIDTPITILCPVVDPDGPLASCLASQHNGFGTVGTVGGELSFSPPAGLTGQAAFHVLGCDSWGWCDGVWVVVDVLP